MARIEKIEQSILAKAFQGDLVEPVCLLTIGKAINEVT